MIFSLVAIIGLKKCCITSAYLQWLCHSRERGPLVFVTPCFERLKRSFRWFSLSNALLKSSKTNLLAFDKMPTQVFNMVDQLGLT